MELLKSASVLFILLNPFLMSIYLISLSRELSFKEFSMMMIRAHVIGAVVFIIFALAGDAIFESVFKVRFASFLIFGGIVFLLIGIRSIISGKIALFTGAYAIEMIARGVELLFTLKG